MHKRDHIAIVLMAVSAYIFLLLGMVMFNGEMLAYAVPFLVCLFAAFLQSPGKPAFQVTRTLSNTCVTQDVPVEVVLTIRNAGERIEECFVEDMLPAGLVLMKGDVRVAARLAPGELLTLTYTVSAKRGSYAFRHTHIVACEHLGLFRRRTLLDAPERLLVMPTQLRLRRVSIRPLQTRGYAGPVPARRGGPGVDFFGVREYQPGDPQRWINWRISARHTRSEVDTRLFTTEFEQERVADVGLILDARRRNDYHIGGRSLFEYSVSAAAALSGAFLSDGNRVGLLIYGRGLEWTFPGYGKVQRKRVLRALAQAKTGDSLVFESLDYLPTRFFPAKSQVVLISPLCDDDPPMLSRLRSRGYQVLVVSPDPLRFEVSCKESVSDNQDVAVALRLARLERQLLMRKLRSAGIAVVDWDVDAAFDQVVHAALGRLPLWFRTIGVGG
ncbi:MAG: DUF58 domain-containing protein [Anaerolineae bacterium]|nr:DUF58 domain-containing protein [Anaerolineae bacterium]